MVNVSGGADDDGFHPTISVIDKKIKNFTTDER
jgi:hypothetical protein